MILQPNISKAPRQEWRAAQLVILQPDISSSKLLCPAVRVNDY